MRCFIALDLSKEVVDGIKQVQNNLPDFVGKKTEAENLHLTLKFLGEVSDEKFELVKERLNEIKIKKFETEIDSIGVFSEKIIRIVWMHLTNCDALQKEIDDSLKDLFKPEQRFMGHLTIARIKNVKDKREFLEKLKKIKVPKMEFVVDNFKLKSSILKAKGPVYEALEVYDLE